MVKTLPAKAGEVRDRHWIPGSGRSPGGGNGSSSFLAWRIPWTGERGGLQSMGSQSQTQLKRLSISKYFPVQTYFLFCFPLFSPLP